MSAESRLRALLDERIVVLDGAWGTMLQRAGLDGDYRGALRRPPAGGRGRSRPAQPDAADVVLDIHRRHLAAGADITTTNTFTATSIGQADYGLEAAMNVAGAACPCRRPTSSATASSRAHSAR